MIPLMKTNDLQGWGEEGSKSEVVIKFIQTYYQISQISFQLLFVDFKKVPSGYDSHSHGESPH